MDGAKAPYENMNLQGQDGELRFTIEIKRAATGEIETVELIGKINDSLNEDEELKNGSNALDSGT